MATNKNLWGLFSALLIFTACATPQKREPSSTNELNLRVYRIEIGRKSPQLPIAELYMPKSEFDTFLATRDFRDRDFRSNVFYSGCYQFEHTEHRASRAIASQRLDDKNKSAPIFCYDSPLDVFRSKSNLLP
jgi:hypothetical protein